MNGIEFSWEALRKKLNLKIRPHDEPGIYFYLLRSQQHANNLSDFQLRFWQPWNSFRVSIESNTG